MQTRAWTDRKKLIASDGGAGDLFRVSVAMSGSMAVIGAGFQDAGINLYQGGAYVWVDPASSPPPMSVTIDVKPGDLVLHFETDETGVDSGDGEARLTGRTMGGASFEGADSIQTDS